MKRLVVAIAAALTLAGVGAGTAAAAETSNPPVHAAGFGLEWVPFIAPEDRPARPYAVCVVDSGVNVTPDTPPDNPAGPIVLRDALDGGTGEGGTDPAHLHGTRMAMAAVGPVNGWGQIGAWPGGRIVSIRAMRPDQQSVFGPDYRRGIDRCLVKADRFPLAVVSLSLGCRCTLDGQTLAELEANVQEAHNHQVSVVAAAGNEAGARLQAPANVAGVLAVAAGHPGGALCSYASYDGRVAIVGPACGVELADPLTGQPQLTDSGGSSTATAVTATVIALLRSYRPQAGYAQVEAWVRQGARTVDGRPVLDAAGAMRAAGLDAIVDRARAAMPSRGGPPPPAVDGPIDPGSAAHEPGSARRGDQLPRPRLRGVRLRRGRLTAVGANRLSGVQLELCAQWQTPAGWKGRCASAERDRLRVRAPARWERLRAAYIDPEGYFEASPAVVIARAKVSSASGRRRG